MNVLCRLTLLHIIMIGLIMCQQGAINLKRDLFKNYDPQSRPVENSSQITNVCAGLYILQIVGLSEKSQIMSANIQLVFIWNDSFLKWNATEYENVSQLFVRSSMIWTPDIIIMDSAEEKISRGYRDNYLIIVNSSGKIRWHYQTLSKSFCAIDIMNFPFDEQTCSINIRSSVRDKSMLRILKRNLKVKVMENIRTEWFIVNSSVEETTIILAKNSHLIEYTVLKFTLKLRRVTTHYFVKIIFPFSIIAAITLFTFWLAPDSGEKLTLDVTILLSLVFYLQIISDYIPRGFSKMPILTLYTLTNFSLVFLSCVFTVLVLRLYYKTPSFLSPTENQLPYLFRLILFKYIGPILCLRFHCRNKDELYTIDDMKKFDKISKRISKLDTKKKDTFSFVQTEQKLNEYVFNLDRLNMNDSNDDYKRNSYQLLNTLKMLNKYLRINYKEECLREYETNEINQKLFQLDEKKMDNLNQIEKRLYYEEWKQASLVLDRLFFCIFSFCMPMTTIVFFRTNFYEYITSTSDNDKIIENLNC